VLLQLHRELPKPYEFIGFGDIHGPKPYEFIGFGDIRVRFFFFPMAKLPLSEDCVPLSRTNQGVLDRRSMDVAATHVAAI
jgi:hypothetical protein